jgi:hypothetical protein
MLLAIDMNQYSLDNVFFNEQQKNSINETNFIRFIYSSKIFSLQGICIYFHLPIISFDLLPNQYNKYKCLFSVAENNYIIQFIRELEINLLKQVKSHPFHINKIANYKLYEQFQYGEIKLFKQTNSISVFESMKKKDNLSSLQSNKINTQTIIIKISGIWSSNDYYGLTYKLLTPN